jgi:hypothetical protein
VMQLVVTGLLNKQIAADLGTSEHHQDAPRAACADAGPSRGASPDGGKTRAPSHQGVRIPIPKYNSGLPSSRVNFL